jgi:hypothetical protein
MKMSAAQLMLGLPSALRRYCAGMGGWPARPQADGFNGTRRAVEPELRITIESVINNAFRFHGVEALSSERAASPARLNKTQIKQQPKKSIS